MAVRIRLQRHGKKGKPFYFIVAADARAKRDGKYIERLGSYNPNTNPATIELDVDGAVKWLQNGAEATNTARAILSYKGAIYKNHLLGGVAKGAFDEAEAEKRFAKWSEEKEAKIQAKLSGVEKSKEEARLAQLAAEKEARENAAKAEAAATEEASTEEAPAEEAVADEASAAETTEEVVAEEANATEDAIANEEATEEGEASEEA